MQHGGGGRCGSLWPRVPGLPPNPLQPTTTRHVTMGNRSYSRVRARLVPPSHTRVTHMYVHGWGPFPWRGHAYPASIGSPLVKNRSCWTMKNWPANAHARMPHARHLPPASGTWLVVFSVYFYRVWHIVGFPGEMKGLGGDGPWRALALRAALRAVQWSLLECP